MSPRLRLCERCWRQIPPAVTCRIRRHSDPDRPFLRALRSYEHLHGDPSCLPAAADDVPERTAG